MEGGGAGTALDRTSTGSTKLGRVDALSRREAYVHLIAVGWVSVSTAWREGLRVDSAHVGIHVR